jgi:tRNA A-37 threonylcarbamoyl transferase component Bud32
MTGALLAGRYRLEEPIASGGMGEVWRATDTVLRRCVAVKILSDQLADDAALLARFRHEARTMAALRHPGIAAVYDYGECTPEHSAYLAMAYIDGQPLSRYIATAGRLGPAETAHLVAQVARALHAVHLNGVIHRDVKPGNLILRSDGTVVLVDFGVAYTGRCPTLTDVNEVVGTAIYMAPEQASKQPLTPATDVYALGTVAYHCLAGHPPFEGDSALTIVMRHFTEELPPLPADVPPPLCQLVARAMAKDPADRYPSAAAMARAAARAVPATPEAARRDRRTPWAAAAGIASAVSRILSAGSARDIAGTRSRTATPTAGILASALALGGVLALAGSAPVQVYPVEATRPPHVAAPAPADDALPPYTRNIGLGPVRAGGTGTGSNRGDSGGAPALPPQQLSGRTARGAGGPGASPSASRSPSPTTSPPGSPSGSPTASPSATASPTDGATATPDPGGGDQTTPPVPDPSASTPVAGP